MFGSALGNVAGTLYFLVYQAVGILIAFMIFRRENRWFKLLFGSVMGSFLIHWLPTLMAFLMDFTLAAHISALMLLVLIFMAVLYFDKKCIEKDSGYQKETSFLKKSSDLTKKSALNGKVGVISRIVKVIKEKPVLVVLIILYCYTVKVWSHHVLTFKDGAVYAGQCTYGDMNMHLGFITSIPELMTFFESQKHYKKEDDDMLGVVEATNNLLTSNILNLFAIQTIGILITSIL